MPTRSLSFSTKDASIVGNAYRIIFRGFTIPAEYNKPTYCHVEDITFHNLGKIDLPTFVGFNIFPFDGASENVTYSEPNLTDDEKNKGIAHVRPFHILLITHSNNGSSEVIKTTIPKIPLQSHTTISTLDINVQDRDGKPIELGESYFTFKIRFEHF